MPNLYELKKQVEELEAQASAQKIQEPVPSEPVVESDDAATRLKNCFDILLAQDRQRDFDAEARAYVAATNALQEACPSCYRRQAISNVACELCGAEPTAWLPSQIELLRQEKQGGVSEHALDDHWLKWAATKASIAELKHVVAKFSTPGDTWKIKHAAKILKLHGEAIPKTFWGEVVSDEPEPEPQPKPEPERTVADRVKMATQYYDIQIEKIDREIAALRSGQSHPIS